MFDKQIKKYMKTLKNLFKKKERKSLKELQQTKFTDELIDFRRSIFNHVAILKVK